MSAAKATLAIGISKLTDTGTDKTTTDITDALTRNGAKKAKVAVDDIDEELYKVHCLVPELQELHTAHIETPKKGVAVAGIAVGGPFMLAARAAARRRKGKRNAAELDEMLRECKHALHWIDAQIAAHR